MENQSAEQSYWTRRRSRRQLLGGAIALAAGNGALALACGSNNPGAKPAPSGGAATAAAGSPAAFSGPPAKITVSVGAVDPAYLIPYLAKETGIFQKNGLDVTIQAIPGPMAIAAIISGQIQIAHAGGGETLAADVGGGDVTIIAAPSPAFPGYIYSAPNVKTAADAKGKKAAITNPGGSYDIILRASLQKMGLDPDKDVTVIATGSIPNAFTALLNGAVSILPLGVGPNSIKLDSMGYNKLFDPIDIPIDTAGVDVQHNWLNSNRAVAQRYIDSLVEGIVRMKQDKSTSLAIMKKDLEITDDQVLNVTYAYYSQDKVSPTLPYPKAELFGTQLAEIAKKTEAAKNFDVAKILDQSLVQSAADRHLDKL
jgi:NitT/TauT family transport system substrate-binding protein